VYLARRTVDDLSSTRKKKHKEGEHLE
jgi:hypothetical protein